MINKKRCITDVGGKTLYFSDGKKDEWCVYVDNNDGKRPKPPCDKDYFMTLLNFSLKYGRNRMYNDFIMVYNMTTKNYSIDVVNKIIEMSKKYDYDDSDEIAVLFTTLYMTMISEENYKNTRLGKRIKRLGVYQVLMEGLDPACAAKYTLQFPGGWRAISLLCEERGF